MRRHPLIWLTAFVLFCVTVLPSLSATATGTWFSTAVPPAPKQLQVKSTTASSVTLSWNAIAIPVIAGYRVYRDGVMLATVSSGSEYTDATIQRNQTYAYTVRSRTGSGVWSRSSQPLIVNTSGLTQTTADQEPPSVPYPVISTATTSTSVALSWSPARDNVGVHRYEVFRNGQLIGRTVGTVFRSANLFPEKSYEFRVRALDLAGNRSAFSYPLRAVTPPVNSSALTVLEPRPGMIYGNKLTVRAVIANPAVVRVDVFYAASNANYSTAPAATQSALPVGTVGTGAGLFLLTLNHSAEQAKIRVVARNQAGQVISSREVLDIQRRVGSFTVSEYGKQMMDGSTVLKNNSGEAIGTRFILWSKHAERAQVWLYGYGDNADGRPYKMMEMEKLPTPVLGGFLWVIDAYHEPEMTYGAGLLYGYRVWGPNFTTDVDWRPGTTEGFLADVDAQGNRFNPNKLLVDPYARTINKDPNMRRPEFFSGNGKRELDSAGPAPKSIVYDPAAYSWGNHAKPNIPMKDTIIYEVHVRGYTFDQSSGVKHPGTFKGFTEKLDHLQELGVTAVELLPIHETPNDDMSGKNRNFWGYSTVNYFAADRRYTWDQSAFGPIHEFRDFVKTMHAAGKEVLLDVVYNHTAEDGHSKTDKNTAAILSLRGIDNQSYYSLSADRQSFYDNTGCCGANVNVVSPKGQQFIIDSLRYWVDEMRVDGFRFDLSAILGNRLEHGGFDYTKSGLLKRIYQEFPNVKLIAEPWAIGDNTYQVGHHPGSVSAGENAWSEWQDKFRQTVRYALRGDSNQIPDLVKRVAGSSDLYEDDGRRPYNSINYVVSHDGYTLNDLFSVNGTDSWDSGGSDTVRRQLIRNAFTLMAVSAGTPMILGGDEMRRTQQGNKNAYNQDNPISWYNWNFKREHRGIFEFSKAMLNLRNDHPALRRGEFFTGKDNNGDGLPDIQWHGVNYRTPDWSSTSRVMAWRLDGSRAETKAAADDNDFYVMVNNDSIEQTFQLPPNRPGKKWRRVADTAGWAENNAAIRNNVDPPGQEDRMSDGTWTNLQATTFAGNTSYLYKLNPRSIVVLLER